MMLRNFLLLRITIGLLLTISFFGCDQKLEVAKEETKTKLPIHGKPPKLVIDEDLHNFGSMEVEQTLKHEFTIRNEGEGPLILKKDRSTCKCTMADFDEKTVEPGDSFKVTLEWIGKAIDPEFSQAAYIKTNDPEHEEIALKVAGRVDQTFDILPAGAWTLGEMNADNVTEFNGTISSRIYENFEIKEFVKSSDLINVKAEAMTAEELAENGFKKGFHIVGQIVPGAPIGQFSEKIEIKVDLGGEEKVGYFTVEGYYSGPMQIIGPAGWRASDMLLVMGRFSANEGKKVTLSMFLRDNPGPPLEAKKITSDPDIFLVSLQQDVKFQAENRERYTLTIEVPPGGPPLVHEKDNPASIVIETNNPLVSKMAIQVNMIAY